MINPPGYPWAPLGTYRVPLVDAHSVALGANFIVSWTILKISKPTTISGEYVIFLTKLTYLVLLATPEYL